MNKVLIVLLLSISSYSCAEEVSTWIERSGYVFISEHEIALNAAKKYTVNEKINKLTVHYEYQISTNKNGFYIFVIKYTLNKELKKLYYPGGHYALDVDKNGNVIKFYPGA